MASWFDVLGQAERNFGVGRNLKKF